MQTRILLVEDDETTRLLLTSVLGRAGYQVSISPDGADALRRLAFEHFDVVLTDIRMREVDGIKVLNNVRRRPAPPAVILLTGHGSLETAIAALRAGAFNYLLKPCDTTELLECVAAAAEHQANERRRLAALQVLAADLQRFEREATAVLAAQQQPTEAPLLLRAVGEAPVESHSTSRYFEVGVLCLDVHRHTATSNGEALHLTPTEFALLCCLAETPGRVINAAEIVQRTHGRAVDEADAQLLLRPHVRNLRRKLPPGYLMTVRTVGYMLVNPASTEGQQI